MNNIAHLLIPVSIACFTLVAGGFLSSTRALPATSNPLTLWYDKPAASQKQTYINEALPIGNGKSGALITGGVGEELLRLNEISLWTGDLNPKGVYETMGEYQALADLIIRLSSVNTPQNYRRDLNLATGQASVSYTSDGVNYRREYFASHEAGIMVVRLTADLPASYSGTVSLQDRRKGGFTQALNNLLLMKGTLPNGMKYEGEVLAIPDGGLVTAHDGVIDFKGCNSLLLLVGTGTSYIMDSTRKFQGEDPHDAVSAGINAASKQSFEELRAVHFKDYQALFGRVVLDLGSSTPEQRAMPTDKRRLAAAQVTDPELQQLLFQYGRYLMISCSRPGGLPANLQGLWNDSNNPPWHSDYHANINIQMNYWPVEVANLSECHMTFFDLVESQLPCWRETSKDSGDLKTPEGRPATRGWAIRTSHNITGGMGWKWDKTANAWYASHFWEHYAFGNDREYLRRRAYPLMKEVCEYWQDHLKALPDGRLVVPHCWSPEHGPSEDGVSYSQEIVWDLFNNTVQAADTLGVDKEFRDRIATMRDTLFVPGIGSWGQLLEWMAEKRDPKDKPLDTPEDHHRHTSHLFAVYPGSQINLLKTPELAKAAEISLKARGDLGDVREWSFAWRCALYARLHQGDLAESQIRGFFGKTCPNLFGNCPPMQMDGNFGITAAISEMLLQSHEGNIVLLPALPSVWSAGSMNGLRARGGFEVAITWREGLLSEAGISSKLGGKTSVVWNGRSVTIDLKAGENRVIKPSDFSSVPKAG